jgi:hypothetical protein
MNRFLALLAISLLLYSCNSHVDVASLESQVIRSMQTSNQDNGNSDIVIQQLELTNLGNNFYSGILYTIEDNNQFFYEVEVKVIGNSFEWQILTTGELIDSSRENQEITTYIEKDEQTTVCSVCGKSFKGNGYQEQIDGSWKELSDDYQGTICSPTCGRKNNEKLNDAIRSYKESNSTNNSDNVLGNDGRVYEKNACGLCKGTGIETGRNIATGEKEGRICPMCDGKGVRSY